jgi:hypothetical protein
MYKSGLSTYLNITNVLHFKVYCILMLCIYEWEVGEGWRGGGREGELGFTRKVSICISK